MGRSNCSCKCIKDPSGLWDIDNLIGAKVYVRSMPVSNFFQIDANQPYTIEKIYFRVTIDGKTITIISLKEFPNKEFTWKDLMIEQLANRDVNDKDKVPVEKPVRKNIGNINVTYKAI
jgi:hypothetical protein